MDSDSSIDDIEVERQRQSISGIKSKKRLDVTSSSRRPEFRYSDVSVDDILTVEEMPLLANDQTWLYYEEGQDPNEHVDVYSWLNLWNINDDDSLLSECDVKHDRGGGHDPKHSDQKIYKTFKKKGDHHIRSSILLSGEESVYLTKNIGERISRDIDVKDSVQTQQKRTVDSFECATPVLENISSPCMSLLESITMTTNTNKISSYVDSSSYEENHQIPQPYESPCSSKEIFQPVSMSTPTNKTNHIGLTLNQSCEDLEYEQESCKSFTNDQRTNITDSQICNINLECTVPSTSVLSKSDPSLLDSVQDFRRRKSLNTNYDLHKYKINRTFESKKSSNNTIVKTQKNNTFTLEQEDDNASSASDGSHKSSSLIRSLGDVRSLARQQEETLMMSGTNVNPVLKKGVSDDCSIHIAPSAESCALKNARSSYGSASSINNNNNTNSSVTGFLKRTRYGLSSCYGQGQRISRSGSNTHESGIRMPGTHSASTLRGSSVRGHVLSRIPRSLSRLPTPNIGSTHPTSSRGSWRDGCY